MKKKLIGAAVIVAFFVVPVAVKLAGKQTHREAELATVQKLAIHPSILATGNLVFRQEVQLSAEVIGKVAGVLVKEGDQVGHGQILLKLDPTVYLAEVAQQEANRRNAAIAIERAQINLANQQRNLDRTGQLYKAKYIDISKYDDAVHQVDLARVELRASRETLEQASALLSQAREHLAKTEVRAPIDGTVTAVPIKILGAIRGQSFDRYLSFGPGLATGVVLVWLGWPLLRDVRAILYDPVMIGLTAVIICGGILAAGMLLRRGKG